MKDGRFFIKDFNNQGELRKKETTEDEKLEINESNVVKKKINDIIDKCRKMVGSFKHSEQLTRRLNEKQVQLNSSQIKLVQDVPTRWNSTHDMLNSIFINRNCLISMSIEPVNSTIKDHVPKENEFTLIEELIDLLEPLNELTTNLSGKKYVSIFIIYPAIYSFINSVFPNFHPKNLEISNLKEEILKSLKARFSFIFENNFFKACTYLHYKYKKFEFVSNIEERNKHRVDAKNYIINSFNTLPIFQKVREKFGSNSNSISQANNSSQNSNSSIQTSGLTKKKSFLSQICDQEPLNIQTQLKAIEIEFQNYDISNFKFVKSDVFTDPLDPLVFYSANKENFPILTTIIKAYFATMATSVPSESLFSIAGLIHTDLRNRMRAPNLEMLSFIKHNSSQFLMK